MEFLYWMMHQYSKAYYIQNFMFIHILGEVPGENSWLWVKALFGRT